MFHKQHGRCAICKIRFTKKNPACTDHNHKTGKFRGLLCHKCNKGTGIFMADKLGIKLFLSAIKYTKTIEGAII